MYGFVLLADTVTQAEIVFWVLFGGVFIIGIVWAIISRVNKEKRQDKFEDRDN